MVILGPMLALMIWIGFNPTPFLSRMESSVNVVLEQVNGSGRSAQIVEPAPDPVTLTDATSLEDDEGPEGPVPSLPGDQE